MPWFYYDFRCFDCGDFDALCEKGEETEACPECGQDCQKVASAPSLGFMNDPSKRAAELKRRSKAHSIKEARANPEKLAKTMGGKPKAQAKWNIRSQKTK